MSLKIAQSLLLDSFNSSSVELDDTFLVSDNLNLSITSNNISNNETFGEDYPGTEKVFWALLLIPLPLVAVIGNILVILSVYKERSLQTVTNYFIVSLAFADLLVAAVVMPFAVYVLQQSAELLWLLPTGQFTNYDDYIFNMFVPFFA
ncbi:dopamine D2-like receptor [Trichonephila clavata]|uniref:Dopamine D2-like receptor n=1 Tax=Trichonephila clavata TaxID=2740835 RepID=A0A8X6L9U0_TRICU|nr:dopamine D2-like receptor [Trichonephila clavata]